MKGKNRSPFSDGEAQAFLAMMCAARLAPKSDRPPTPSMLKACNACNAAEQRRTQPNPQTPKTSPR